ncbi:MAG: fasciclin domain-containing protein [Goleter apudmare HA4340-LM2]|jgi:uncharacterized surface protein with fasciclin (FAS1) repeats|nr:fasciclin domain-containing protein [Goleter apudmare HA4340-LM2]
MNTQKYQKSLTKTVAIAIAIAGILINVPSFAGTHLAQSRQPATTARRRTNRTIVDVLSANPEFKTLVTAVKAAELEKTLAGKGPFTVFAPTNAAFAKLPEGTVEKLLQPENKATLQKVLTYHVVSGRIDSKSIKPGEVKTVEGSPVSIKVENGKVTVDDANVTKADIKASNGIIHAIDTVLIPPGLQ